MPTLTYPGKQFVNADVKTMALSLLDDSERILDDHPMSSQRRSHLLRASSHLLSAFAELEALEAVLAADDRGRRAAELLAP